MDLKKNSFFDNEEICCYGLCEEKMQYSCKDCGYGLCEGDFLWGKGRVMYSEGEYLCEGKYRCYDCRLPGDPDPYEDTSEDDERGHPED
jgi:hypothetical protein